MRDPTRRTFCAMALSLPIAGCLRVPPPPPDLPPLSYAARQDGPHRVEAVPIEEVPEQFRRQVVPLETELPAGTIIVNTETRHLYLLLGGATRCVTASASAGKVSGGAARQKSSPAAHGPPGRHRPR